MAKVTTVTTETTAAYLRFVECCTGTEIFFRGSLPIVNGTVYSYIGSTALAGTGGNIEPGNCYTVFQEYTTGTLTYPGPPTMPVLSIKQSCLDPQCPSCNPPQPCPCPEGFEFIDGECIKITTTTAEYSGQLIELEAGDTSRYYCDFGLRLYPDISAMTWPIYGYGTTNALYTLNQNNGAGPVVIPTANVQNEVWGKGTAPCSTVTNTMCPPGTCGGRLNIAGVGSPAFPVNQELAFEFCITVDGPGTKQYMLSIAGDNYVKFYIDGNLAVFLNVPGQGVTTPFRHWHTFPITLSPGTHTIKLAGLNIGAGSAFAFAAEIYDTNLSYFQANLMAPAVSAGNCGTSPAQLEPFILFSTRDMVGQSVANPNQPGIWSCPNGGEVEFCNGTPTCTLIEKVTLTCACYLIIPCDGSPTFVSNNDSFEPYVDGFITVNSKDYLGCAYIVKLDDNECLESIQAFPDPDFPCECDLKCYYVSNTNGFLYVDSNNELIEVTTIQNRPYIKICSRVYPVVENDSANYTIVELGDCTLEDEIAKCSTLCFKLTNCADENVVIYSNSDTLLPYAFGTNNTVELLNKEGCWKVSLASSDCNCLIVDVTSLNPNFFAPFTATANSIGTYNGNTLYSFVNDGTTYYIWKNEKDQWILSYDDYGDSNPLAEYVAITIATPELCPVSIDGSINWGPRIEGVSTTTSRCPAECDCPIDVTVTSSYTSCEDCIGYIAYKLISCDNNDVIYTLLNLEQYIGQVVKIDCGCYIVQQINYQPPNPQIIKLEDVYTNCVECTRTYWKLIDCLEEADPIITYTDLSSYVGKTVKIKDCNECWIVEPTTDHIGAIQVLVTQEYEDCIECGMPATCECSTITNLNETSKTYGYYDCDNIYHEITLAPGETSDKFCVLEWVATTYCDCFILKYTVGKVTQTVIATANGEILNGYPVYDVCTGPNCGTASFNGTNWIIYDSNEVPLYIMYTAAPVSCPHGLWRPITPPVPDLFSMESYACNETCNCITLTITEGSIVTVYTYTITGYDAFSNPIYTDIVSGSTLSFNTKTGCWDFFPNISKVAEASLCNDIDCPVGSFVSKDPTITYVAENCTVPPVTPGLSITDHVEFFGECKFGNCPQPEIKNNRTIRPGYNTPNCNPDEYDKITCKFSQIMYKVVLEKRYGITNCCPDEDEKWLLKKELIDLQALKDPNYCCPDCPCSCNSGKSYSSCNCGN